MKVFIFVHFSSFSFLSSLFHSLSLSLSLSARAAPRSCVRVGRHLKSRFPLKLLLLATAGGVVALMKTIRS